MKLNLDLFLMGEKTFADNWVNKDFKLTKLTKKQNNRIIQLHKQHPEYNMSLNEFRQTFKDYAQTRIKANRKHHLNKNYQKTAFGWASQVGSIDRGGDNIYAGLRQKYQGSENNLKKFKSAIRHQKYLQKWDINKKSRKDIEKQFGERFLKEINYKKSKNSLPKKSNKSSSKNNTSASDVIDELTKPTREDTYSGADVVVDIEKRNIGNEFYRLNHNIDGVDIDLIDEINNLKKGYSDIITGKALQIGDILYKGKAYDVDIEKYYKSKRTVEDQKKLIEASRVWQLDQAMKQNQYQELIETVGYEKLATGNIEEIIKEMWKKKGL